MFELLQPNKKEVGNRLRQIKDELDVSFTEFGKRLGLKKTTINAYVRGDNLAPIEVIEKVAKITGKPIGWFYFGEMEEYIFDYLSLKGQAELLKVYPNIPLDMKKELLESKEKTETVEMRGNTEITTWINPNWENEFGYPFEEYLDDMFYEYYFDLMKKYLREKTIEYIKELGNLSKEEQEEVFAYAFSNAWGYFSEVDRVKYKNRGILLRIIKERIDDWSKKEKGDKNIFSNRYLVGNLINKLKTEEGTEEVIGILAKELTENHFSTFFGGHELVEIFQAMRSSLIELYAEKTDDDFYEWFAK